jgi:hypothetical protein
LSMSKNPMAKKRRFERVQCGTIKSSRPVAPEPQIQRQLGQQVTGDLP